MPPPSTRRLSFGREKGCVTQINNSGATIKAPSMSPSHQVDQIAGYCSHRASRHRHKVVAPKVALTAVLTMPASRTNLKMSYARSKAFTPWT